MRAALGIDPAKVSGWSVLREDGRALAMGEASTALERLEAVRRAADLGVSLVAAEYNTYGNMHTIRSLSGSVARWQEHCELLIPDATVLTCSASQWRRPLNPPRWQGTKAERRKAAKAWAVAQANKLAGAERVRSHDVGESILITLWAIMREWNPEIVRLLLSGSE